MAGNCQTHVLLIGIDNYANGTQERLDVDGKPVVYSSLTGAVNDILDVEAYLLGPGQQVQPSSITKLLAPLPSRKPPIQPDGEPKYKVIIESLQKILDSANPGDRVYIHYSGHGARATTVFPEIKKGQTNTKWDEAIVPCDIRNGGRYIRDLELGLLFHKMAAKKLDLSVVLDCCHSGGGVRGGSDLPVRAAVGHYKSNPDLDTPKSKQDILHHRDVMTAEPSGYSLMAACWPDEIAQEHQDEGRPSGVFTSALLAVLRQSWVSPSPSAIWNCICARVHDNGFIQRPRFIGDRQRFFFGRQEVARNIQGFTVRKMSTSSIRLHTAVCLSGSIFHGVQEGSEYAVVPFGATSVPEDPVILRIDSVSEVSSAAKVNSLGDARNRDIRLGCQAVLVHLPFEMRCRVALSGGSHVERKEFKRDWEANRGNGDFLRLIIDENDSDSAAAEFHVSVDPAGQYRINGGHGAMLPGLETCLSALLPALHRDGEAPVANLIRRLRHLARFRAVKTIFNSSETSKLKGMIFFDVFKHTANGTEERIPRNADGEYVVKDQERVKFVIRNRSQAKLSYALLDIRPVYAIDQFYPQQSSVEPIEYGEVQSIGPVRMCVPPSFQTFKSNNPPPSVDIFKLFVTTHGDSFHSLTMPAVSEQLRQGRAADAEEDARGDAMGALLRVLDTGRCAILEKDAGDWQVLEIRIRTEYKVEAPQGL